MTARPSVVLLVALLAVAGTPMGATAAIVEHVFTGPVTETSTVFPQVQLGDPFTATLRFDTTEVPAITGDNAFYTDYTFRVALDGLVFLGDPFTTLVVTNDSVLGDRLVIDGVGINKAGFGFEDPTATVFDSFALPIALDPSDFAFAQILVLTGGSEGDFAIRGDIASVSTTVVPEPDSSVVLLSLGGAWASITVGRKFNCR